MFSVILGLPLSYVLHKVKFMYVLYIEIYMIMLRGFKV